MAITLFVIYRSRWPCGEKKKKSRNYNDYLYYYYCMWSSYETFTISRLRIRQLKRLYNVRAVVYKAESDLVGQIKKKKKLPIRHSNGILEMFKSFGWDFRLHESCGVEAVLINILLRVLNDRFDEFKNVRKSALISIQWSVWLINRP